MAKYITNTTELTSIANAIRTKGGTSASLEYPTGFVSAIQAISTGIDTSDANATASDILSGKTAYVNGSKITGTYTVPVPPVEKDVNFYDYKGTLCYSYTATEAQALEALPSFPTLPSTLTADTWNWTLAQIKSQLTNVGGVVNVGLNVNTTSGATEIDIVLNDANFLSPYLQIGTNGETDIDWGDGSSHTTFTGSDASSIDWYPHTYAATGSYTIKITVASGKTLRFKAASNTCGILSNIDYYTYQPTYAKCIRAVRLHTSAQLWGNCMRELINCEYISLPNKIVEIGSNAFHFSGFSAFVLPAKVTDFLGGNWEDTAGLKVICLPPTFTSIGSYEFKQATLKNITIPYTVTSIGSQAFYSCKLINELILPPSITTIGTSCFSYMYGLNKLIIKGTVTTIPEGMCNSCHQLEEVEMQEGVTTIGQSAFAYCRGLREINIPSTVTTIDQYAFRYVEKINAYYLNPTSPPSIQSNTFQDVSEDTIFYVPYSADHSILNTYKAASIWSNYASQMQEMPAP